MPLQLPPYNQCTDKVKIARRRIVYKAAPDERTLPKRVLAKVEGGSEVNTSVYPQISNEQRAQQNHKSKGQKADEMTNK